MLRYIVLFILSSNFNAKASDLQKVDKRDLSTSHHPNEAIVADVYNLKGYIEKKNYNDNENIRSSDPKFYKKSSRRLFDWFSKLIQRTTPQSTYNKVTRTELNYKSDLKERKFLRELYQNLTEALTKISEIHKHVSNIIEQREASTILTRGKPHMELGNPKHYHKLVKRDASLESSTPSKLNVNNEDNKSRNNNKNTSKPIVNVTTECPCNDNNTSGRRSMPSFTASEVKMKLLLYLKESFHEINNKIQSLKDIKEAFSDDYSFRIGYIMANIDALEVNMLNLKNNMEKNKDLWEDRTILELFDTLKVSNQAMSGLTESLKLYIDKLASYNVQSI